MPCIVPTCGASVGSMRLFPQDLTLSERWLDAIFVGCGVKVARDFDNMSSKEICQWHFGTMNDESLYQEPKAFFNCKEEQDVKIDSCRLCLRFYPICDMVSETGELSALNINVTLKELLNIDVQSKDFLKLVCPECLSRLDQLKATQKDFMTAEMKFQNLVSIIRDNDNEICKTVDLRSSMDLLTPDKRYEFSSDSDFSSDEVSDDEWKPSEISNKITEHHTNKRVKSETISHCDDTKKWQVSLRDIVSRKCYICQLVLENASSLASHLTETHGQKRHNRCEECSLDFYILLSYNKHLSRHDQIERPNKCSFCPIRFKWDRSRKFHEIKHHGNNHVVSAMVEEDIPASSQSLKFAFQCLLCNELCSKYSRLKQHVLISHSNESYPLLKCPHCPRTFISRNNLFRHKLYHTDKCVCQDCGKRFVSRQCLQKHIASIHEQRQFDCPISLEKTYKSESALQQHINLHVKGKQFSCDFCDKSFGRKYQLTVHRRLHTGEKPMKCENCSARFGHDGSFRRHKKTCLARMERKKQRKKKNKNKIAHT